MSAPASTDSKQAWVDYAVEQGLDEDEARGYTRDELAEMLAAPEPEVQDQGSLDAPIQFTAPVEESSEESSDVGTPELREEARARVGSRRKPFPWEAPPPGQ